MSPEEKFAASLAEIVKRAGEQLDGHGNPSPSAIPCGCIRCVLSRAVIDMVKDLAEAQKQIADCAQMLRRGQGSCVIAVQLALQIERDLRRWQEETKRNEALDV